MSPVKVIRSENINKQHYFLQSRHVVTMGEQYQQQGTEESKEFVQVKEVKEVKEKKK